MGLGPTMQRRQQSNAAIRVCVLQGRGEGKEEDQVIAITFLLSTSQIDTPLLRHVHSSYAYMSTKCCLIKYTHTQMVITSMLSVLLLVVMYAVKFSNK